MISVLLLLFAAGVLWLAMTADSQLVVVVRPLAPPSFHYYLPSLLLRIPMPRLQEPQPAFVVVLPVFVASTFGEVPKAHQRLLDECH
jgi:hypothetical protein